MENNNLEEAANLKEASTSNTKSLAASMQNLKMNSSKNAETVSQKSEEKSKNFN